MKMRNVDGRWLALLLLAGYLSWVIGGGHEEDFRVRWRALGVDARPVTFVDLYVIAAAQTELSAGRDPVVANPTDPMGRPYNYPPAWLLFMRLPMDGEIIKVLAVTFTVVALGTLLLCWGRLTAVQGIMGGLLLCSPAVMLGVERGNTDQIIFSLMAAGILIGWEREPVRRRIVTALWVAAAVLKLYPVVAFAAWWRRPWREACRRLVVPALALGGYFFLYRTELLAGVRVTASGWILSYGAAIPAKALIQAWEYYYGITLDPRIWQMGFVGVTFAGILLAAWHGWRLGGLPWSAGGDTVRSRRGFQVGALIYVGTFLAGSNFDYRQLFVLPVLPALWLLAEASGRVAILARAGLVCLLLSTGINFLLAGWPGFFAKETGNLGLALVLTALLAADRAGVAKSA